MTQDEIIEMSKQAGAVYSNDHAASLLDDEIIIFAKLVAAKEREACAKVCDVIHMLEVLANPAEKCAKAIRARNND